MANSCALQFAESRRKCQRVIDWPISNPRRLGVAALCTLGTGARRVLVLFPCGGDRLELSSDVGPISRHFLLLLPLVIIDYLHHVLNICSRSGFWCLSEYLTICGTSQQCVGMVEEFVRPNLRLRISGTPRVKSVSLLSSKSVILDTFSTFSE